MRLSPNLNDSSTTGIGINDPLPTIDGATGREVRAGNHLNQLIKGKGWIFYQLNDGITDFRQVVRRNIGSHTNRNTG